MDKLLFGISGLPLGDGSQKFTYKTGISYLKSIGLDSMEMPFVRSINVTDRNRDEILKEKHNSNLYISAHGSYFINLNADDEQKQDKSIERIINGALALKSVQGRSLVFHPGYYLDDSKEETYTTIKQNLLRLPNIGVDYRLETTGKATQFGDIYELVQLSKEILHCKVCIDFSHLHARENGSLKSYDDFVSILSYVEKELGREAIEDMHIHLSGINYGPKGEKNHLPFKESDFKYKECLMALKDFKAKGSIVCESPILERDALLLKETYYKL